MIGAFTVTEPTKTEPTKTEPTKTPEEKVTAGSLRDFIRQEIANLMPGKKEDAPSTEDGGKTDIRAQVQAALQALKAKESREQRDKEVDAMLEKYNKPPEETAPVERRWIEKFMRWDSGEEKKK